MKRNDSKIKMNQESEEREAKRAAEIRRNRERMLATGRLAYSWTLRRFVTIPE